MLGDLIGYPRVLFQTEAARILDTAISGIYKACKVPFVPAGEGTASGPGPADAPGMCAGLW